MYLSCAIDLPCREFPNSRSHVNRSWHEGPGTLCAEVTARARARVSGVGGCVDMCGCVGFARALLLLLAFLLYLCWAAGLGAAGCRHAPAALCVSVVSASCSPLSLCLLASLCLFDHLSSLSCLFACLFLAGFLQGFKHVRLSIQAGFV